ncbi:hypothetical protein MJM99_31210, partial [Salmonella enterica subsp. enterica serovar Kentucky]|nr:hypothetical protein [Salmonella enterica subsp. enterica serovar Kentucky]
SGTWKATLVLDYLQWGGDDPLGTSTTDITLNVTDHFAENAAIGSGRTCKVSQLYACLIRTLLNGILGLFAICLLPVCYLFAICL